MSKAKIYYHDIGDYLSREEKLATIKKYGCVDTLPWKILTPNEHGDWLNQRNDIFGSFIPIGDKDNKQANTYFVPFYSNGLKTQRDAWCYNSSKNVLENNIKQTLDFYNEQRIAFMKLRGENQNVDIKSFISYESTKISWTRALEWDIEKNKIYLFNTKNTINSLYRPFFKQHLYFSRALNEMVYQIPKLFPNSHTNNLVICASGVGVTKDFSTIITDTLPDLELIGKSQCFPLYYYEERQKQSPGLFDEAGESEYIRRDGVSDFILTQARKAYGNMVGKEDIFYYVYGFLHCPEYRIRFANDLKKMLPRIPLVDDAKDFWTFSKSGRKLAELHINYESVPAHPDVVVESAGDPKSPADYKVEKMRFPKKDQKDTIFYNNHITISIIPAEAYEYIVNGNSAIEWIMERYQITTHKESGIRNDPNDWATEVGNPRYILDLLLSIINVSVQTVQIVKGLPEVRFE
jgi:predicted helicase